MRNIDDLLNKQKLNSFEKHLLKDELESCEKRLKAQEELQELYYSNERRDYIYRIQDRIEVIQKRLEAESENYFLPLFLWLFFAGVSIGIVIALLRSMKII